MRAVMTVIGPDRVGIIAGVSGLLAEKNVNVLDLSQTIMGGIFTMMLLVDTAGANCSFEALRDAIDAWGGENGLSMRIQREDTFSAMHRI